MGYNRIHEAVSMSMPAQQTVSPYFTLGFGYALTVIRTCFVSSGILSLFQSTFRCSTSSPFPSRSLILLATIFLWHTSANFS